MAIDDLPNLPALREEEFGALAAWTYFNHASDSPLPARSARVLRERIALLTDPQLVVPAREAYLERAQLSLSRLIGGLPEQIAFLTNIADATGVVVNGFDWQSGDEVLVVSGEFASFVLPWKTLARRGVSVRVVAKAGVATVIDDVAAAITPRTRVLAISHVEYLSGYQNDLAALGALCRANNLLFVVDASQSLGVMPVDAEQHGVDVLVAVGYKWLMSPHGISVLYVSPDAMERIHPSAPGRYSVEAGWQSADYELDWFPDARRYQSGALNWLGVCALAESAGLLDDVGVEAIAAVTRSLTDALIARLADYPVRITSDLRVQHRSSILTFTFGSTEIDDAFVRFAGAAGVLLGRRAFGIRCGAHFWNTGADLDRLLFTLGEFAQVQRNTG